MEKKNSPILLVEDDQLFRHVLCESLKVHGFTTFEANEGGAAAEILKSQDIDLILSDIQMPGKDGLALLHEVKEVKKLTTPVVMMSGLSTLPAQKLFQMGAHGILQKPFSPQRAFELLQHVLMPREVRWRQVVNKEEYSFPMFFEWNTLQSAIASQILNIGSGGFFTALNATPPPVGTLLEFEIDFVDSPELSISGLGVIRWVRDNTTSEGPRGCGIEFVRLEGDSYERVLKLVAKVDTGAYIPER